MYLRACGGHGWHYHAAIHYGPPAHFPETPQANRDAQAEGVKAFLVGFVAIPGWFCDCKE